MFEKKTDFQEISLTNIKDFRFGEAAELKRWC